MGKNLDQLGYTAWCKDLFYPDFGLCQSRKRLVIVAGRKELVEIGGDIKFLGPVRDKYASPIEQYIGKQLQ
jgi:site-specific DNA-cytosine methylase